MESGDTGGAAQSRPGRAETGGEPSAADLSAATELFASARRITVLTGAGVSTGSGIPDFRGPDGVWTTDPAAQRLVTLSSYVADPAVRRAAWQARAANPAWHARPNAAHHALVDLERTGRLRGLLTQNIDGLHQRAGSDPDSVVELHGSLFGTVCLDCGARGRMREALDRVARGEPDPACRHCGGILKSTTVFFGEALDPEVLRRARTAALDCELLVAVGTSLTVQPAAGLLDLAARAGAAVLICNAEPTPYDQHADAVLRGPVGESLPRLVAATPSSPAAPRRSVSTWGDPSTWP